LENVFVSCRQSLAWLLRASPKAHTGVCSYILLRDEVSRPFVPLHPISKPRLRCWRTVNMVLLLHGGELLAERCRSGDLLSSIIPICCLPPCRMDPKVLGLDIFIIIVLSQVVRGRPTVNSVTVRELKCGDQTSLKESMSPEERINIRHNNRTAQSPARDEIRGVNEFALIITCNY